MSFFHILNFKYDSPEKFNNDLEKLGNAHLLTFLCVQKDGSISEVGIFEKLKQVISNWLFDFEDRTSKESIDSAFLNIITNNVALIPHLNQKKLNENIY